MLCIHVNNNDDNNNDNINNNKININDHLGDNEKVIFVLRGCNSSTKKKKKRILFSDSRILGVQKAPLSFYCTSAR